MNSDEKYSVICWVHTDFVFPDFGCLVLGQDGGFVSVLISAPNHADNVMTHHVSHVVDIPLTGYRSSSLVAVFPSIGWNGDHDRIVNREPL